MVKLPLLNKSEETTHDALTQKLKKDIHDSGGTISFSSFMERVLYDREIGYYTSDKENFGNSGDYITAPMISNIFAKCFLNVFFESFSSLPSVVLELGAGNGQFAMDFLVAANKSNIKINQYLIYEISKTSIKKQKKRFQKNLTKETLSKISWVSEIPESYDGIIFANEFLDAFPTDIYEVRDKNIYEREVIFKNNQFEWQLNEKPISNSKHYPDTKNLPCGYIFEYSKKLIQWLNEFFYKVNKAQIFFVDYGFCERELFHQDRMEGTLMCHYKHFAHDDPFKFLGTQDITWHIDFSQIAKIAKNQGFNIDGFVSQANFLINSGALDLLAEYDPNNISEFKMQTNAFQKLISPAEMGDLIKVLGISKNMDLNTMSFKKNNRKFQL